ncbi:MAG: bifunctional demethylmenaquinone methyltransferase/2-methoxy-6-polyprenyl-1,4-benzoquinol methylase UbiE [Candidatus Omnitrophota bacterium]
MMEQKEISQLFSSIAEKYDFLNHFLSLNIDRYWRRRFVRTAGPAGPRWILDLCTGTGDVALEFAKTQPLARIAAVDISEGMLRQAGKKTRSRGLSRRIQFFNGSAFDLPFKNDSFDVVSISFGFRNLFQHRFALEEMKRVLRPRGEMLILEFSPSHNGFFLKIYRFYLKNIMPAVGRFVLGTRRPYDYLASTIQSFLTPGDILDLMRESGFKNVSVIPLTGGVVNIYRAEK